jgi:hypothetical protein
MRETVPTSAKPAPPGRLGLALFLVLVILGSVGIWSGWLRPYAGRHLGGFDVGLRVHYQQMLRDLNIK